MAISPQDLRAQLLSGNAEFQRLVEEHSRYEAQLEQLSKAPYLSSEDMIQEITLKKLKLRVKDQMERLLAQHWKSPPR